MLLESKYLRKKLKMKEKIIDNISSDIKDIRKEQEKIGKQQLITDNKVTKINKSVKKISNVIDMLNTYCLDAKVLTKLTENDVEKILKIKKYKKHEFEELIIRQIKAKKLSQTIGDMIEKRYVNTEKPKEQQVWTSDISRLIYLIFQTIDNEKMWYRDRKGVIFTELIMNPITEKLKKIMSRFAEHNLKMFDEHNEENLNVKYLNTAQLSKEFCTDKFCKEFIAGTIKYLADKFSVSLKREEIECSI